MKKLISLILILALSLACIVGIVACNEQDEVPPQTDIPQVDTDDTPEPEIPSEPIPEPVIPVAEFTMETIEGVKYIYYGSMPQKVVDKELNNVLANLVSTFQLAPNEKGLYDYAGISYTLVRGTEETSGRRLSNGLYMEKDGYYFFITEKIRWRVLEEKEGEATLLSENVLGSHVFNPTDSYHTSLGTLIGKPNNANDYSASALRTYVNERLFEEIFTTREQKSILERYVTNRPGESAYPLWQGIYATTQDKMYVPSYWEIVEKYHLEIEENLLPCNPISDYLVALGHNASQVGNFYYSDWWLRTSGSKATFGHRVTFSGVIGTATACSVNLDYEVGVRPIIVLKVQ